MSARRKFTVVFIAIFMICLPAIPLVLHDDHRILQQLTDLEFILFGILLCAAYGAFLSGCGLLGKIIINRCRKKTDVEQMNP